MNGWYTGVLIKVETDTLQRLFYFVMQNISVNAATLQTAIMTQTINGRLSKCSTKFAMETQHSKTALSMHNYTLCHIKKK